MEIGRGSRASIQVFELVGGIEDYRRLSLCFHERVEGDVELRRIFPKNMEPLTEWLALFLAEETGGPRDYTEKRGKQSLFCRHAHLSISTEEANRWLGHMFAAMDDVRIEEVAAGRLRRYFTEIAQSLTDPFLPYYDLSLEALVAAVEANCQLLQISPTGHSLLRDAVCRWDAAKVGFLLESGADAAATEPLGHGLLYRAANAVVVGLEESGVEVVGLLVRHGADVNLRSGPGKSTPLHLAARRGSERIAEALLAAGADIEASDSKGETSLRRAVNCGKHSMILFLLSKGADPSSRDRYGRTAMEASRNEETRLALFKRRV